jgi:zinc finger protein
MLVETFLYRVPYFGSIIMDRGECAGCGFKYRDVKLAELGEPKKILVRVEGERELRYLVVKPSTALIYIPERGYESVPGPYSPGYITTVEGILSSFLEALNIACGSPEEGGCRDHYQWLSRAINGEERFTLVMCDYEGAGKILGEGVLETGLDAECRSRHGLPAWTGWEARSGLAKGFPGPGRGD